MRKALAALCLGALALAPAGAPRAQALRVGVQSPFTLDPHFLFLGPNMAAARHIFDSLVGRDADSNWVPGLAESWTLVSDRVWEFRLRQGVTFHDGTPFTAEDVAFTLNRIPNVPNNPGPYTTNLRTIERVEVVDPYTVRIHTDRPNPVLPGQLTNIFVVSAALTRNATTADFNAGRAAIGTGPFRLLSYSGPEGMRLARNDRYWGRRPDWEEVRLRIITNDGARLAALLAGDIDVMENVPVADAERLRRENKVQVFSKPSDRVMFLVPQTGAKPLPSATDAKGQPLPANAMADLSVRRAVSMAIDRKALAERALDGQAVATGQLAPEGFGGWSASIQPPAVDPAGARRLLTEAGYPDGLGLSVACSNDRYVSDARVCQVVGQMLTRAGFKAQVETMPGSVFFPRVRPGHNDMPLMLFGLSLSSSRDVSYLLSTVIHTRSTDSDLGTGNRGDFSDPRIDAMIMDVTTRTDAGRLEALTKVMQAVLDQQAIIPLYNQVTIAGARKGIVYTPRMDEQMVATEARLAR
ncbi:ABC transporter substrate-binding protein [Roseomonas sp. KE0001]|uniref:ABC transporter substrate-binding protein n=1 Tax=Roseomonas sp. KE0001 TaxID=2479201 RepID=UPI0018E05C7D|nr:ABC transporter substrate-binding protein [Roseomonas sp. KE0001]MBI0435899.1 ABC transporter substrate-binding protein [Roseomonas sp. KE0001]